MKKLLLRITIAKSNPQMIREVTVNADISCRELKALVFLVYGVPAGSAVLRNEKKEAIKENEPVDRMFAGAEALLFEFLKLADGREFSGMAWIELLDTEEGERLLLPEVSYANGYQLLPVETSVERMNRYYLLWEHGQAVYLDGSGASNGKDYVFSKRDVHHRLQLYFVPGGFENRLDDSLKLSLSSVFSRCETQRLKELLVQRGIPTFPSQGRETLIASLNHQYTEEFFLRLLQGCMLWELINIRFFCTRQELVLDKGGLQQSLPVLFANALVYISSEGKVFIAEEFLDFLEDWLNRIETKQFFTKKMMQYVLIGSCELYGYVTKELAREVFLHCYPGAKWSEKAYETMLQMALRAGRLEKLTESCVYDGLVYGSSKKDKMSMEKRIAAAKESLVERFFPTMDVLEILALHGSRFEEGQELQMRTFFTKEAGVPAKQFVTLKKRLMIGMKQKLPISALVGIVKECGGRGMQPDTEQKAAALLNEVGKSVRRLELKGHSEKEVKEG